MIEQFHFLRPWCLLLLVPLVCMLWLMLLRHRDSGSWRSVIDERLLPFVLSDASTGRQEWIRWVPALVALFAIVALAGPTWEKLPQPVYHKEAALVIALDLSRSMDATDIKPSRLARARHKIADILNLRKEGQTALVVYAADAFTVTPLTSDVDTILALLPDLETELMPAQGTRADRAVKLALELFQNSGVARGDVLLLSDGLSDLEVTRVETLLQEKSGQRLSVLAIGTREGGPVPLKNGGFLKDRKDAIVIASMLEDNLRRIAQSGGGVYATISANDIDINTLAYLMESSVDNREARLSDRSSELWREFGPWLVLLALPFAALSFRRGVIWFMPLCLLLLPPDAEALEWQDWWQNSDQRAAELFAQQEHEAAADLFENPDWKAASKYKAGDFVSSFEYWQQNEGEDAAYNRANALARLGRYEEALGIYDELLQHNPAHDDARYNRQAIEDWLKQQEQQEQQAGDQQQQQQQQSSQQGDSQPEQSRPSTDDVQSETESGDQDQAQRGQEQNGEDQNSGDKASQQAKKELQEQVDDAQGQRTEDETQANLDQQMSEQAAEQWLRKIPDDPGGLLRRKFIYQYRKRGEVNAEAQPW
ncbi:MAG: VWA domain-containing protein [Gammaproteobacteria bacterium]|nr:VWA domain-containing protein [Gammaproteobacteria bacterium]